MCLVWTDPQREGAMHKKAIGLLRGHSSKIHRSELLHHQNWTPLLLISTRISGNRWARTSIDKLQSAKIRRAQISTNYHNISFPIEFRQWSVTTKDSWSILLDALVAFCTSMRRFSPVSFSPSFCTSLLHLGPFWSQQLRDLWICSNTERTASIISMNLTPNNMVRPCSASERYPYAH